MRYSLLLLLLTLTACSKDELHLQCSDGLSVTDLLTLPDGHQLTLSKINDSRCGCDVVCIWEGDIITELSDADTTLLVSNKFRGGNNLLTHIPYRGYTISIDTVRTFSELCNPAEIPQQDYCVVFSVVQE